jgi:hypothetical protein
MCLTYRNNKHDLEACVITLIIIIIYYNNITLPQLPHGKINKKILITKTNI